MTRFSSLRARGRMAAGQRRLDDLAIWNKPLRRTEQLFTPDDKGLVTISG
jgi:hypothetical protein